jgi:hypothetical protein
MYTLNTKTGIVTRDSDNTIVTPIDDINEAYLEYKLWLDAGNVPTIYVESLEEILQKELHSARLVMWENIKAERDRRKYSGVKVGNNWFHSDPDSRTQQLALVMLGDGIPPNIQWKTLTPGNGLENIVTVPMTKDLAKNIFSAVMVSDTTLHYVADSHRAAVMISDDPNNYNYLVGWPKSFGE